MEFQSHTRKKLLLFNEKNLNQKGQDIVSVTNNSSFEQLQSEEDNFFKIQFHENPWEYFRNINVIHIV